MTRNDFDFFAQNVILNFCDEIKQIDNKKFNGNAISINKKKIPLIYLYYESFRKDIRKLYMTNESKPMDRHKIASNMMFSIIKSKIIKVNRLIPNLPLELLLANEYVAFYCAINIIEMYNKYYGFQDYSIILPTTYIEHEGCTSYVENTCKALYYTKHYKIDTILLFANTLFMLEKYTDRVLDIQDDIIKKGHQEQDD